MIMDGANVAKIKNLELKNKIDKDKEDGLRAPGLAIINVGDDPASKTYIRGKIKACKNVGINTELVVLPKEINEEVLENEILRLNESENIDGIILQLPIPKHLDEKKFINLIDVNKDVDGFTLINQGYLFQGMEGIRAATPQGILNLLDYYNIDVAGMDVVVVGRSQIVGLPISKMLLDRNATVTTCHSRTKKLKQYTINADLIVIAAGSPKLITEDMVKENVVVVDVGINRVDGKLVGDADFEAISNKSSYITPVPKGVGPMTISALLENTYQLYEKNYKKKKNTQKKAIF